MANTGKQGERQPAAAIEALAEQLRDIRPLPPRWAASSPKPPIIAKVDEQADRDEGQELDDRFDRDGQDHAVLMFGRVDVAGAEENGEDAHGDGDEDGEIVGARQ